MPSLPSFLFMMGRRTPRSTLFPYTTLFRSARRSPRHGRRAGAVDRARVEPDHERGERQRRSKEHTSELQSQFHLVCRLLLEKKKKQKHILLFLKQKKNTSNTTQ